MLDRRRSDFAALVWATAVRAGNSAPKIADAIMRTAFPRTCMEAEYEGADKMLRVGIISEIKRILRNSMDDAEQFDFANIDPQFREIVSRLKSKAYFVESADEYVSVPHLIAEPDLLDDAQKFMRKKGLECLMEAQTLRELHRAITGEIPAEKEAGR